VASESAEPGGRRAWTVLLGSSVVYFFTTNEADNDLWGHVLFGRDILTAGAIPRVDTYSYTAAGHPWINHEWLSQVILAAVYRHAGGPGLLLFKLAVATLTFLLLLALVRRHSLRPPIWGGVGLLSIAVLARGFAVRPQIISYLCIAVTLWLLDRAGRGSRGALWFMPPLFALWANVHGGFVLGLAIFGLFAAAASLRTAGQPRRVTLQPWILCAAAGAAVMLNPYGPRLLLYILNELTRPHPITEWQPVSTAEVGHFVFLAMLGLLIATLPFVRAWREQGWNVVLALGIGFLAVRHQRHTPVFALCAAAPLAAQLDAAAAWLQARRWFTFTPASRRIISLAVVALALLQITFATLRWQRDGLQLVFDPAEYPMAAVRALRQADVHANLAVPLDWGEYVLWFLSPHVKVSIDGRFATIFPESVAEDNFNFYSGARGWWQLIDEYPTDAVLVPAGSASTLDTLPDWRPVFESSVARVYARTNTRAWESLSRLTQITAPPQPAGVFP
jgi:hypothetical protein